MRKLTCIICPRGCSLAVDENLNVTGNICSRGEKYAIAECTAPMRTVTATVRVHNREDVMLPVKTEQPVPKEKMFAMSPALAPSDRWESMIEDNFEDYMEDFKEAWLED